MNKDVDKEIANNNEKNGEKKKLPYKPPLLTEVDISVTAGGSGRLQEGDGDGFFSA